MRQLALALIKLYQNTLSRILGNHCRYYPSCSAYAVMQFEHNNLFLATWYTLIRILRCNQFFKGGFDYPKMHLTCKRHEKLSMHEVKYWLIPEADGRYQIIKNFSFKG